MEDITTLTSQLNETDMGNQSITEVPTTDQPEDGVIPRYPLGYFVIPTDDMTKYRLAMYTTIIPLTALTGIVGNVISFVVLLRHKMPQTTKMVLLSITVYDFLNLITSVIFCLSGVANTVSYKPGQNAGVRAYPIFGSYLMFVFGRISSILIVILALERLCAVYFPFRVKTIWTTKFMGHCIVACSLFCSLFFIPNALEYRPRDIRVPNSSQVTTIFVQTELGKNRSMYAAFYSANMIVTRILPVAIVMICNIAISISLYRSTAVRSEMTSRAEEASLERRITKTLLALTTLYFFCMLPGSLVVIIQLFDTERPYPFNRNNVYNLVLILFFWFDVINSSANFIIYTISSDEMRAEFGRVLLCGCRPKITRKSTSYDIGLSSRSTSVATIREMGGE